MSLTFIACVEAGQLEQKAILLFDSIRRNAGRSSDCPIVSYQPRKGPELASVTLDELERLEVRHVTEVLNAEFADYGIGNKIFASAHAEETLATELIVFCDTDTCFLNQPTAFDLAGGTVAAVRPVDRKGRGSTGPGDRSDAYWSKLYELAGAPEGPLVQTAVTGRSIRGYWNAGLIVVRRSAGLFHRWREDFLTLMHAGHLPPDGTVISMDQLSLAATLARVQDGVATLDSRYNYALPKRDLMRSPDRELALEGLVHIHYHSWFNRPGFLEDLVPPLDRQTDLYRWLSSFLPFQPAHLAPIRRRVPQPEPE